MMSSASSSPDVTGAVRAGVGVSRASAVVAMSDDSDLSELALSPAAALSWAPGGESVMTVVPPQSGQMTSLVGGRGLAKWAEHLRHWNEVHAVSQHSDELCSVCLSVPMYRLHVQLYSFV